MKSTTFKPPQTENKDTGAADEGNNALVQFSTRLPKRYKRKFDTIAFHLEISKQDLLKRMIDAYPDETDEKR